MTPAPLQRSARTQEVDHLLSVEMKSGDQHSTENVLSAVVNMYQLKTLN